MIPILCHAQDAFHPPWLIGLVITKGASEVGIPRDLAISLAWEESRFDPNAIGQNSHSTDYGLFQLNSKNAELFTKVYNNGGAFDPMDMVVNTRIGLSHLRSLWRRYGSWRLALWAWNCGRVTNVPKSTLEMADRVLSRS